MEEFPYLVVSKPHWVILSKILIATLSIVCFLNSCWGDFVFDDSEAIIGNKDVNPNTSLTEVFENDFWGTPVILKTSHKSYRPLTVISFRWNYWIAGGLQPFGFHVVNVLLHPVISLLYLEVCHYLVDDSRSRRRELEGGGNSKDGGVSLCALLAGLMFAVHPVHTESVAGIVGRADLMSALCFFAALLCYIKACKTGGVCVMLLWVTLTALLGGCATLFKEQGITIMGVCVVYDIIVNLKLDPLHITNYKAAGQMLSWRRCIIRSLLLVLCIIAILLTRLSTGQPQFKPIDNPASFSDSLLTRVLTYNYIYSLNAWLLLNPWWLCFDWSMGCISLVESLLDTRVLAVLAFWLILCSLIIYCLIGKTGTLKRTVTVALAMMIIPFLPASNLFLCVGFVVAERVLYLPSAGYCLLVALGLCMLLHYCSKSVCFSFFVTLLLLHTARSVQRSSEWISEEALFTSGIKVCPYNAKVLYNIGKVKLDAGNEKMGEAAYREAIRLYPEYDQALNNFGNLLKETGRPLEAERMFHRALKANPEFAAAWMNLGIVQAMLNNTEEAESSYKTAIRHRKKYPDAYYNLGNLYIDIGRTDEAAAAFKAATGLQRDHANAWGNLGLLYENLRMYGEAEKVLREALSTMPENPQFYYSLGVLLGRVNRLDEGQDMLEKAVQMSPTSASYHANLGVIYHLKKDYDKAEHQYQHALSYDSNLPTAKDNLNKLLKTRKKLLSKGQ